MAVACQRLNNVDIMRENEAVTTSFDGSHDSVPVAVRLSGVKFANEISRQTRGSVLRPAVQEDQEESAMRTLPLKDSSLRTVDGVFLARQFIPASPMVNLDLTTLWMGRERFFEPRSWCLLVDSARWAPRPGPQYDGAAEIHGVAC